MASPVFDMQCLGKSERKVRSARFNAHLTKYLRETWQSLEKIRRVVRNGVVLSRTVQVGPSDLALCASLLITGASENFI